MTEWMSDPGRLGAGRPVSLRVMASAMYPESACMSVDDGTYAATVTATVTNTGAVPGAEVVQVYVQDVASSLGRPVRELKGLEKVFLRAGRFSEVAIEPDQRAFSFWWTKLGRSAVEAGDFVIGVGPSSRICRWPRRLPWRPLGSQDHWTGTPPWRSG
jgi:hypothetical protein